MIKVTFYADQAFNYYLSGGAISGGFLLLALLTGDRRIAFPSIFGIGLLISAIHFMPHLLAQARRTARFVALVSVTLAAIGYAGAAGFTAWVGFSFWSAVFGFTNPFESLSKGESLGTGPRMFLGSMFLVCACYAVFGTALARRLISGRAL